MEVEKVLSHYKKFNLTLIGRVNVLKTLALPKLVYLFSVLPNLSIALIHKINAICKKFMWDGGQTKIVDSELIKSIEDGELKLINLETFNISR